MLRHNACRPWVLAFMLAAVWSAQASNYKYHFKKIDRRFDAIAERLNQLDFENRRAEANPKDLQQLAQLAGKHPQLQARSIYWQVRMTQFNATQKSGTALPAWLRLRLGTHSLSACWQLRPHKRIYAVLSQRLNGHSCF